VCQEKYDNVHLRLDRILISTPGDSIGFRTPAGSCEGDGKILMRSSWTLPHNHGNRRTR
jgi:hypothetical protein